MQLKQGTVTGGVHLHMWCKASECPQKQRVGTAAWWLSVKQCLHSAGAHRTLVAAGAPGAAAG